METNNMQLCIIAWENSGKFCWWQINENRGVGGGALEVIGEGEADKSAGNYSNYH